MAQPPMLLIPEALFIPPKIVGGSTVFQRDLKQIWPMVTLSPGGECMVSEIVLSALPCAFKEFRILKTFHRTEQRQQICNNSTVLRLIKSREC